MNPMPALLAYIGPETILPASSILASIGGLWLMFGRRLRNLLNRCVRCCTGGKPPAADDESEVVELDVVEDDVAEKVEV